MKKIVGIGFLSGFLLCLFFSVSVNASLAREIVGAYTDEKMIEVKQLTFPRVLVYDQSGRLIDREHWPKELYEIRKSAGEAFCCVSEEPSSHGAEPPPNCKRINYGEHLESQFTNLVDTSGKAIEYTELPAHKYLIIEYYASWCEPCIKSRNSLEIFLRSSKAKDYIAVIIDFSRLPEIQDPLKK